MNRPAETAGAGGAVAALVAFIAGVKDPQTIVYMTVAVGLIPGAVTALVLNGGIKGVARLLWRGRKKS